MFTSPACGDAKIGSRAVGENATDGAGFVVLALGADPQPVMAPSRTRTTADVRHTGTDKAAPQTPAPCRRGRGIHRHRYRRHVGPGRGESQPPCPRRVAESWRVQAESRRPGNIPQEARHQSPWQHYTDRAKLRRPCDLPRSPLRSSYIVEGAAIAGAPFRFELKDWSRLRRTFVVYCFQVS